jgi:glycosyltransferase involved in cell wall biosynthesis
MAPTISVVIPVYNSEESLEELTQRLGEALPLISGDFEVIFINDGSRDNSWEKIGLLAKRYSFVRGICLMRNYGQHNALLCGIRAATKEITVTMDDDLQHPPEEIAKLIEHVGDGRRIVYGIPQQMNFGLYRNLTSHLSKIILSFIVGGEVRREGGPFRAFGTFMRSAFESYNGTYVAIDVLLHWACNQFVFVTVRHDARKFGRSNYNFLKLLNHMLNLITAFSTRPLRIATSIGLLMSFFGLLVLAYVMVVYFSFGRSVPGFAFLASIVTIFSGAQLFALGIIGEYIARMHTRLLDRPSYMTMESVPSERPNL